jgi:hypothetical protein
MTCSHLYHSNQKSFRVVKVEIRQAPIWKPGRSLNQPTGKGVGECELEHNYMDEESVLGHKTDNIGEERTGYVIPG